MDSENKIIDYMYRKAKAVAEILKVDSRLYFRIDDEKLIRLWDKKDTDKTWNKLKENINNNINTYGISIYFNPFCIFHSNFTCGEYIKCENCGYGHNHGVYCDIGSDFRSISWGKEISFLRKNFTVKWVKKLVEDTEKIKKK